MTVTSDFIACCTRCHPITSPAFSPACLPLARSASATQPSLLFRARHSPASGPLHRLFPLPGTLCHQYLRGSSLVTLFRYFLCCHRLSDRRPRFGKLSLLRQPAQCSHPCRSPSCPRVSCSRPPTRECQPHGAGVLLWLVHTCTSSAQNGSWHAVFVE